MNRNLLLLALLISIGSCSEKTDRKADEPVQVKSVNTVVDPRTQKLNGLKSLTALDLEELKSLLPEEINGIKRTHYSVSGTLGYGMAHADYEKNSKTDIRMTLYDCSGNAGAGIFESAYLNRLDQVKDDENATIRTVGFAGGRAIEKIEKGTNITTLTFLANERILIILSGRNIESKTLEENVQKLELKVS